MKKIIAAIVLASTALAVSAGGPGPRAPQHYGGHHHHGGPGWGWVVPAIIGVIVYGVTQANTPPPPPVIVPPPQPTYAPPPLPPASQVQLPGYYQVQVWVPSCNCYVIQYHPYAR